MEQEQAALAPTRREMQKEALGKAIVAVQSLETARQGQDDEDTDLTVLALGESADALRAVVEAFGPRAKASAGPRATLEKADPADVKAYFDGTGLSRKELAAAAGVSTSVIATVQNEKGDRWSAVTFGVKKDLIDKWLVDHADELKARAAALQAEADAKQAALDAKAAAKAQRAAAKATPKPAKPASSAKAPTASVAKAGRPSAARRQANRKATKAA